MALDEVHRAGVIHCDFKMDNMLVDTGPATSRVFVIDFGVATLTGTCPSFFRYRDPAEYYRYPWYAPELWSGWPASPATDIYALGHMMATVLGHLVADGVMVCADPLVADLCRQMTSPDPALRPSLTMVADLLSHRHSLLTPSFLAHPQSVVRPWTLYRVYTEVKVALLKVK